MSLFSILTVCVTAVVSGWSTWEIPRPSNQQVAHADDNAAPAPAFLAAPFQGAAAEGRYVYVLGRDSPHIQRLNRTGSRLTCRRPASESSRQSKDRVYRLTLDDRGQIVASASIDLRELLADDQVLGPYANASSKENALSIQAIAAKNGVLYVGFSQPVLAGNRAPVLCIPFDRPAAYITKLVDLGGRGIHGLTAVEHGFLILSSPASHQQGGRQLYRWSGVDPRRAQALDGRVEFLAEMEIGGNSATEILAPNSESDSQRQVLILSDDASPSR